MSGDTKPKTGGPPVPEQKRRQRSALGHAIWRARREARLTQRDLAVALRCSVAIIAHWETGRRTPGYELAARLRRRLKDSELATLLENSKEAA